MKLTIIDLDKKFDNIIKELNKVGPTIRKEQIKERNSTITSRKQKLKISGKSCGTILKRNNLIISGIPEKIFKK